VWQEGVGWTRIGGLPGFRNSVIVFATGDLSCAWGVSVDNEPRQYPWLWTPTKGLSPVVFPGMSYLSLVGLAEDCTLVANLAAPPILSPPVPASPLGGFRYADRSGFTRLEPLAGDASSQVLAMSRDGKRLVGFSESDSSRTPVLWLYGTPIAFPDLLPDVDPELARTLKPWGIDATGRMVYGDVQLVDGKRGWYMRLEPAN